MTDDQISRPINLYLYTNLPLMEERGLMFGQLGTSIGLLCNPAINNPRFRAFLISVVTNSLAVRSHRNDYSLDTGALGIGCGVLFLKINDIVDSQFEEIFKNDHIALLAAFNQEINNINVYNVFPIHCLMYFHLLALSNTNLTRPTKGIGSMLNKYTELINAELNRGLSPIRFQQISYAIRTLITYYYIADNNDRIMELESTLIDYIRQGDFYGYLSTDYDFIRVLLNIPVFSADLDKAILKLAKKAIINKPVNIQNYKDYISLKQLNDNPLFPNQNFNSSKNKSNESDNLFDNSSDAFSLLTLKGGFPRKYIYAMSKSKKISEILLL